MLLKVSSHEPGVVDAHAESEAPHRGWIVDMVGHFLQNWPSPRVGTRIDVAQCADVVAPSAAPRDVSEVLAIMDSVVHERGESALIDSVPESQFSRDPVVEPLEDRKSIAPLGNRGEPKHFNRFYVVEQFLV